MKDFAMQLTQKCVSMGLLDESYSEWFAYSIEKRVTTLFTWLVQCLIGGFCFGWTLTISFSVFFLLIRKYTNGYHAATYSKCLFCSILLEVVLLASISYVFRTGLALLFLTIVCNGVQREHNKKLNNGLPILHKVPPKRDYGRYFCIMAEKGGTSHGGLTEKLSPFFHAKKQEVNAYGR